MARSDQSSSIVYEPIRGCASPHVSFGTYSLPRLERVAQFSGYPCVSAGEPLWTENRECTALALFIRTVAEDSNDTRLEEVGLNEPFEI